MKKIALFISLLLALMVGFNAPAHAKESAAQSAGRRAIVAAQARLDRAHMDKDYPAMMSYIADDFMFYTIARLTQNREQYERIQRYAATMPGASASKMTMHTTVTKWQWRGPDAVVWTTNFLKVTGANSRLDGLVRSREYWGKTSKGWQLRQVVELSGRMTMNGETVEM